MNELKKSLKKLSPKERETVGSIIEQLISIDWLGLNIVKLKGADDLFRVRKGRLRIIFQYRDKKINIIAIERRSEKTYRKINK